MVSVSIAGVAASIGSSVLSANASSNASDQQAASANQAAQNASAQNAQTRADLAPYRDLGNAALSKFDGPNLDQLTQYDGSVLNAAYPENPGVYNYSSFVPQAAQNANVPNQADLAQLPQRMDQATLEQTPGYQFELSQGLKSVQNSAAARGLGISGAAMKGAASYATGLADETYQKQFAQQQQIFGDQYNQNQSQFRNSDAQFADQFNQNQANFRNDNTIFTDQLGAGQNAFNQQNQRFSNMLNLNTANQTNLQGSFNRLTGLTNIGQNSAAQTGSLSATNTQNQGQYITGAGNAQAAGSLGMGNALSGGINSAYNGYVQNNNMNRLYGGAGSAGSYSGNGSAFDNAGPGL